MGGLLHRLETAKGSSCLLLHVLKELGVGLPKRARWADTSRQMKRGETLLGVEEIDHIVHSVEGAHPALGDGVIGLLFFG